MDKANELYEMIFSLQAEISALKTMMYEANPLMAARHQTLTERIRKQLLSAWKRKQWK
jgi:hypothetical protein